MKFFLLTCALLCISSGYGYSENCGKGPEYWCQDLQTAVGCGALRHCQQTVWFGKTENSQSLSPNKATKLFCNNLAGLSAKLLNQGMKSVDLIKSTLKSECTKLTDLKFMIPNCQRAVDSYTEKILENIQTGVEVNQICSNIMDPNGSNHPGNFNATNLSLKSAECTFCKFLITYLDTQVQNNRTPAAIEAVLEKICNAFPASLQPNCTSLVKKFGPVIAILLATNATPVQVCNFIKFCNNGTELISNNVKNLFSTKIAPFNIPQCSLCRFLTNYAESVIGSDSEQTAFKNLLTEACSVLPITIRDRCNRMVQSYGSLFAEKLKQQDRNEFDCKNFKLC